MKRIFLGCVFGAFVMACGNHAARDAGRDTGTTDDQDAAVDNPVDDTTDIPMEDVQEPVDEPAPPDVLVGTWRAVASPPAGFTQLYTDLVFNADGALSVRVVSVVDPASTVYPGCVTTLRTDGYHWEHATLDAGGDTLALSAVNNQLTTTGARSGCTRSTGGDSGTGDNVRAFGVSGAPPVPTGTVPIALDTAAHTLTLQFPLDGGVHDAGASTLTYTRQ